MIANQRIPIIRRDADGTIVDGTAELIIEANGTGFSVVDFRDLDGEELILPPQSSFEFATELPFYLPEPIHANLTMEELGYGSAKVVTARYRSRRGGPLGWMVRFFSRLGEALDRGNPDRWPKEPNAQD